MFTFRQHDGAFFGNGINVHGYSGFEEGKNNPDYQEHHDLGPIPRGFWTIEGPPFDTDSHGPVVVRLVPKEGTNTFDRSGFLIHGDSIIHPGMASKGCIILARVTRLAIWESGDRDLEVVE